MKIGISGAGVAGPALAFWLIRTGHQVTLIEHAPAFRAGGYIIDFWGVGYDVAERMGLIPAIRAKGYQVDKVRFVKETGATAGAMPVELFSRLTHDRYTSLLRGDLAQIVFESVSPRVETLFGQSIAAAEQTPDAVTVRLSGGETRDFDLLVGADGVHSAVRRLLWGPDEAYLRPVGFHVAAFEVPSYPHRDEGAYVSFARPGLSVSRFAMENDRSVFLFVFDDKHMPDPMPASDAERKAVLEEIFADMGWETREILAAMAGAPEIYFDRVAQAEVPQWSKGRAVLIGDAAACPSLLAGEGTSLALVEAYVLAGELNKAGAYFQSAFQNYDARLRPFLTGKQKTAREFATSFAPKTELGIFLRNVAVRLMAVPPFAELFLGPSIKDDFELPDYGI